MVWKMLRGRRRQTIGPFRITVIFAAQVHTISCAHAVRKPLDPFRRCILNSYAQQSRQLLAVHTRGSSAQGPRCARYSFQS